MLWGRRDVRIKQRGTAAVYKMVYQSTVTWRHRRIDAGACGACFVSAQCSRSVLFWHTILKRPKIVCCLVRLQDRETGRCLFYVPVLQLCCLSHTCTPVLLCLLHAPYVLQLYCHLQKEVEEDRSARVEAEVLHRGQGRLATQKEGEEVGERGVCTRGRREGDSPCVSGVYISDKQVRQAGFGGK